MRARERAAPPVDSSMGVAGWLADVLLVTDVAAGGGGSAARHCHNLRFLTEQRMMQDPALSEDQARAIDVQPCPPPRPFSGLQVLCMVDEEA